jgi:hypothetical protein
MMDACAVRRGRDTTGRAKGLASDTAASMVDQARANQRVSRRYRPINSQQPIANLTAAALPALSSFLTKKYFLVGPNIRRVRHVLQRRKAGGRQPVFGQSQETQACKRFITSTFNSL